MGFPPFLNLSTRLFTAALPGQTTKTALTEEFMFQNVAYRPTVYRTGHKRASDYEHLLNYQGYKNSNDSSKIFWPQFDQCQLFIDTIAHSLITYTG